MSWLLVVSSSNPLDQISSSKSHTPCWVNWYNEDELFGKDDDDDEVDKDKEAVTRLCVCFRFRLTPTVFLFFGCFVFV